MKIYGFPTFNVVKVLLTAELCKQPYEYENVDLTSEANKKPEYLAINPMGKVPAIVDDGQTFNESAAICRYIAAKNASSLYGGSVQQKAVIDSWSDFMTLHAGRWMSAYFWQDIVVTKLMQQTPAADAYDEAKGFLAIQLPVLEARLSDNKYLAGDTLSIADVIGASYCQISEVTSLSLDDYPAILAWYQSIRSLPEFAAALANFPGNDLIH